MTCLRKKSSAITHDGGVQNKFIKIKEELNKKDRGKQVKNKRVIVRGKKNFDEDEQKKERFLVKKIDENYKDGAIAVEKRKRVENKRVIVRKKKTFDEEAKKERFLVKKIDGNNKKKISGIFFLVIIISLFRVFLKNL